MKPQSRKAKGRKLQQWVRDLLISLGKGLTEDDVRSTSMGAGGEDVLLSPKARKQYPLSFECKNVAKFVGYTHLDQAIANTPNGCQPVVVMKANRRDPVVIVDAEYFFRLVRRADGNL